MGTLFSGTKVKLLKSALSLNGGAEMISTTLNPAVTAINAPIGSLLTNTTTGRIYQKLDAGTTTNWLEVTHQPQNLFRTHSPFDMSNKQASMSLFTRTVGNLATISYVNNDSAIGTGCWSIQQNGGNNSGVWLAQGPLIPVCPSVGMGAWMSVKRVSGTGGVFYLGADAYDANGNAVTTGNNNSTQTGLTGLTFLGITPTTNNIWYTVRGYKSLSAGTIGGSEQTFSTTGSPIPSAVRYIRVYILALFTAASGSDVFYVDNIGITPLGFSAYPTYTDFSNIAGGS